MQNHLEEYFITHVEKRKGNQMPLEKQVAIINLESPSKYSRSVIAQQFSWILIQKMEKKALTFDLPMII